MFAFAHILTHNGDGILRLTAEASKRDRMMLTYESIRGCTDGYKPCKEYPCDRTWPALVPP